MKYLIGHFITIGLCVVLLCTAFLQHRELVSLRQSVYDLNNSVNDNINQLESDLFAMQEGEKLVQDVQIRMAGIVPESHIIKAEVKFSLREWRDDTKVWLIAGGLNTQQIPVNGGNGAYSVLVNVPSDLEDLSFRARIETGGLFREETLKTIGAASNLLPVQMGGGGWATSYDDDGIFTIDDCGIFLHHPDGGAAVPIAPKFCVSVNGETVLSETARQSDDDEWLGPMEGQPWKLPCMLNDEIQLAFTCEDAFGLGYIFPVDCQIATARQVQHQASHVHEDEPNPALIWPE